jgi:pimeloyl-ACP methyl ester carboxylesterase
MSSIWVDTLGSRVNYYGNKYKTRVIEYGEGEPLFLIHGIGGHAEAYSRNILSLGKHFRTMSIDLLWHGCSSSPELKGDQVFTYVDQLIDLMNSLGIENAHFEGESLGGRVAMWMAIKHPNRVKKLILNTSGHVKFKKGQAEDKPADGIKMLAERSLSAVRQPTKELVRKRLEWLMASPERVTDELVDVRYSFYSHPVKNKGIVQVFEDAFIHGGLARSLVPEEELQNIKVPTLVLWSDKNPGKSPDVGRKIADLLPNGQFYCIHDAAHWPQWEKPEEHDQVVISFLKQGSN